MPYLTYHAYLAKFQSQAMNVVQELSKICPKWEKLVQA